MGDPDCMNPNLLNDPLSVSDSCYNGQSADDQREDPLIQSFRNGNLLVNNGNNSTNNYNSTWGGPNNNSNSNYNFPTSQSFSHGNLSLVTSLVRNNMQHEQGVQQVVMPQQHQSQRGSLSVSNMNHNVQSNNALLNFDSIKITPLTQWRQARSVQPAQILVSGNDQRPPGPQISNTPWSQSSVGGGPVGNLNLKPSALNFDSEYAAGGPQPAGRPGSGISTVDGQPQAYSGVTSLNQEFQNGIQAQVQNPNHTPHTITSDFPTSTINFGPNFNPLNQVKFTNSRLSNLVTVLHPGNEPIPGYKLSTYLSPHTSMCAHKPALRNANGNPVGNHVKRTHGQPRYN